MSYDRTDPRDSCDRAVGGLSPELSERFRRANPPRHGRGTNEHEDEFYFVFGFDLSSRKSKLEAMKVRAENWPPVAMALAVRNSMLFHIEKAIAELPRDEQEVRSASQAEMKATIERIRRRWDEIDQRAAGLIVAEQGQPRADAPRADPGSTPTTARAHCANRKSNGLDYRLNDALLVAEMRELIQSKKARSSEDAARFLVIAKRAEGRAKDESKIKRLALHYRQAFATQS